MRKALLFCLLLSMLMSVISCGAVKDDDEKDCPSFYKYQVYPEVGQGLTEYEMLVILKSKSENQKVTTVVGRIYNSDGSSAQKSIDLVKSNADQFRYVRAFLGSEVCDTGTCHLFFKVEATHLSGCIKTFKTDVFTVQDVVPAPQDDDDDDTTDDDDLVDDDDDDDNDDDDDDNDDDASDDDDDNDTTER